MREVIDEILGTEKGAVEAIEEARKSATEIKNKADVEVARLLAAAREEAQAILRDEMQRARDEARRAHEVLVRRAEEENARFLERKEASLGLLVDGVVKLVLTPEHAKR